MDQAGPGVREERRDELLRLLVLSATWALTGDEQRRFKTHLLLERAIVDKAKAFFGEAELLGRAAPAVPVAKLPSCEACGRRFPEREDGSLVAATGSGGKLYCEPCFEEGRHEWPEQWRAELRDIEWMANLAELLLFSGPEWSEAGQHMSSAVFRARERLERRVRRIEEARRKMDSVESVADIVWWHRKDAKKKKR